MIESEQGDPSENTVAGASKGYANYVLAILFLVYVFNFVDRQIVSIFIGPIRAEFGLSDTQVGLLVGFAFALLYTFAGIPIARLADRKSRRTIIAIGLAFWSAMTVATGMARSTMALFAARVGVGLGEAAGTPPAHSLIVDYFSEGQRARALAIYSSAVFFGSGLAYIGGGYMREHFDWRTAFYVLGIPGVLFAFIVFFTVREPARVTTSRSDLAEQPSFMTTLTYLVQCKSWRYLLLGSSSIAVVGYGLLMWVYEFYARLHGLSPVEIGLWMALSTAAGGAIGTVAGGWITDYLYVRSPSRSIVVPGLLTLSAMPFGAAALMAGSVETSMGFLFVFTVLLNMYMATMYNANQCLAKPNMRATATAIVLFSLNLVGAGLGPLIIGGLSDFFSAGYGDESIRYALLSALAFGVLGSSLYVLSGRHFEGDLRRIQQ